MGPRSPQPRGSMQIRQLACPSPMHVRIWAYFAVPFRHFLAYPSAPAWRSEPRHFRTWVRLGSPQPSHQILSGCGNVQLRHPRSPSVWHPSALRYTPRGSLQPTRRGGTLHSQLDNIRTKWHPAFHLLTHPLRD